MAKKFQYRKRYEITCDENPIMDSRPLSEFQYRKRYEITCDIAIGVGGYYAYQSFNTASGMRSHVTRMWETGQEMNLAGFNTASGMRSHVTPDGDGG